MGSHEVDAHGNLFKERLTSKGDLIATEEIKTSHFGASSTLSRHFSFGYDNQDVDRIKKMIHSGEGCRIKGIVKVNKVPGNVHLSTYSHSYLFGSLYQETRNLNISHTINHLSFGVDTDISYVQRNIKGTGIVSPLDGVSQTVLNEKKQASYADSAIFEYYTKVVPTTYAPLDREPLHVYQFTANSNKIVNQQMPSLYIRYDFSPVTVRYRETKDRVGCNNEGPLFRFVVVRCGVCCGVCCFLFGCLFVWMFACLSGCLLVVVVVVLLVVLVRVSMLTHLHCTHLSDSMASKQRQML
ncbi:unnamed protein product [Polarella glacialis]|uniref:Endoplasmic reticulum vesicle transporter C-terminal domain-containing protein n=1 Tax=Polarella glacialis TaxID=89957 RepID=A0A813FRD2_POLGL|nr:unnamed protein product [Polarella glacialis]